MRADAAVWLTRHWLAVTNALLVTYAALPVLEPLLRFNQLTGPADAIISAYSYVCHQLPPRSYFLAGFQMAFCERDTALYSTMALSGLAWARFGPRVPRLHWSAFLLLCGPIALDGFTQLFDLRESTWQLRTATGALFGVGCVWFGFPLLSTAAKLVRIDIRSSVDTRWQQRPHSAPIVHSAHLATRHSAVLFHDTAPIVRSAYPPHEQLGNPAARLHDTALSVRSAHRRYEQAGRVCRGAEVSLVARST